MDDLSELHIVPLYDDRAEDPLSSNIKLQLPPIIVDAVVLIKHCLEPPLIIDCLVPLINDVPTEFIVELEVDAVPCAFDSIVEQQDVNIAIDTPQIPFITPKLEFSIDEFMIPPQMLDADELIIELNLLLLGSVEIKQDPTEL